MPLDAGVEAPVFALPRSTPAGVPELFAPTEDAMGLDEAVLAAVVDVDKDSRVLRSALGSLGVVRG